MLREANGDVIVTMLHGTFSYASARELARRGEPLGGHKAAVYDFSQVGYVDTSAALAIEEMLTLARSRGMHVLISGLQGAAHEALRGLRVLDPIPRDRIFADRRSAIRAAVELCRRSGDDTSVPGGATIE